MLRVIKTIAERCARVVLLTFHRCPPLEAVSERKVAARCLSALGRGARAVPVCHGGGGPARQVHQVAFAAACGAELVRPVVAESVGIYRREARLEAAST